MIRGLVVALLGGAALWAAFDPLYLPYLSFLGIALYGYVSRLKGGAFYGFVCGLAFFLPLTEWARISVGQPLPWIALACLQALFFAAGSAIIGRLWSRAWHPLWHVLGSATVFTCVELVRSSWPWGGFPWGTLAFAQVGTPLLRLAPYVSSVGVTFIAAIIGWCLLRVWDCRRDIVLASGIAVGSVGAIMAPVLVALPSGHSSWMRVGWVQGGTGPENAPTRALGVTQAHVEETKKLLADGQPDLIVWPESASDHDIRVNKDAADLVREVVDLADVPLMLGTQEYLDSGRYNDVLLVDRQGIQDRYSKSRPVPFGEYIPSREFFARFTSAVDLVSSDMIPGVGPATITIDSLGVRLATPICFEIAIDSVVREAILDGGEAIIVPVNTASFGHSAESMQQLRQTQFRAVEYSRGAIQVATQGVSAVVAPNGVITTLSTTWSAESGITRLPLRTVMTPAALYGPIYLVIVASAGAIVSLSALLWRNEHTPEARRHCSDVQRDRLASRPVRSTARTPVRRHSRR